MTDRPMREVLQQLHATLEGKTSIGDEDRALLRQLAADIQAVLAATEAKDASLRERLESAIRRFEVTHPDLAAVMGRAAKTLSDMGI